MRSGCSFLASGVAAKSSSLEEFVMQPVTRDGRWYYTRVPEGEEYPVYCRKRAVADCDAWTFSREEVLLDQNVIAQRFGTFLSSSRAYSFLVSFFAAYMVMGSGFRFRVLSIH
jgi:protease II